MQTRSQLLQVCASILYDGVVMSNPRGQAAPSYLRRVEPREGRTAKRAHEGLRLMLISL